MARRYVFAFILFASFGVPGSAFAPAPARAQGDSSAMDDFMAEVNARKQDEKRCRNNPKSISSEEQVEACTRLIEDAPNENDLVGEYYVNRATAQSDDDASCADVRKGIQIIENSKSTIYRGNFLDASRRFEEVVCR